MASYRDLDVWKKAMDLVEEVYRLPYALSADEKHGLTSQTRRAAVSVPANIAEGYGRVHAGEYVHHVSFARGSLMELETLLTVAGRLKLVTKAQVAPAWRLAQDVGKMLTRMALALKAKGPRN